MKTTPFWRTKSLSEMNKSEWESLCYGCAAGSGGCGKNHVFATLPTPEDLELSRKLAARNYWVGRR